MKKTSAIVYGLGMVLGISALWGVNRLVWEPADRVETVPIPMRNLVESQPESVSSSTRIGVGWGAGRTANSALSEAIRMASTTGGSENPHIAILVTNADKELETLLQQARSTYGEKTSIYGQVAVTDRFITHLGLVSPKTIQSATDYTEGNPIVSLMTIQSEDISFGIGGASYADYPSIGEAARNAVRQALQNANPKPGQVLKAILEVPFYGNEEQVLEGIEQEVGSQVPVLGGSTSKSICGIPGKDRIINKGITVVTLHTDLPVGSTFQGGFNVTDPNTGIATRVEGKKIFEIDNRPAVEIYNRWNQGKIEELKPQADDALRPYMILNPLYQKLSAANGQTYFLFFSLWPDFNDGSLKVGLQIPNGTRLYQSRGNWETLLNRMANLPREAKIHEGINIHNRSLFGYGIICSGVLKVIPDTEKDKIPILIRQANNNAPFLISTSSGEQGHFPGVGNKHGHLLTSFLVVGEREAPIP